MRAILAAWLLLAGAQDPVPTPSGRSKAAPQEPARPTPPEPDDGSDRVVLSDRTELRGEISGFEPAGLLRIRCREGGEILRMAVEEVVRLQFGKAEAVRPETGDQLRLFHGGTLTGRVVSFDGKGARIETSAGPFRIGRGDIRAISMGRLEGPMPELRDEKRDVLVREVERREEGRASPVRELVAEYGRLAAIGERVRFRVVPAKKEGEAAEPSGEERDFDRASTRLILLAREPSGREPGPGWFAKVIFRNGDKVVGVVESVGREKVGLFSHLFGRAEFEKARIHSISFVQHARMTMGNLVICDQQGVREIDRQGRETWQYTQNVQYSWNARKLENGNVLIANTNFNQVIEVKPTGRTGGQIVWQVDQCSYPYDAVRLENGNTLVAEHYSNRVVEYDQKTRTPVWQVGVNNPTSVQRLEDGHTLVCTSYQVLEFDREGREKWKAALGGLRPWRAQRLDNGNTLITDYQRNQVMEIDRELREVWKMGDLARPVQALRTEEGNTLILEQGNSRLIEIDPSNPKRVTEVKKDLQHPQGMSTY
jgi:hypothetical protein